MLDDIRRKSADNPNNIILSVKISFNRELDIEVAKSQEEKLTTTLQNLYYTWLKSSQEEIGTISCEEYILNKLKELNIKYICKDEEMIMKGQISKKEYYRVPITWKVEGTVYIEAESPSEAAQIAASTDYYTERSRTVSGTVEVPNPENIITDREYRRNNGIGPKYHVISGEDEQAISKYIEGVRNRTQEAGKEIASNIEEFSTTNKFHNKRMETLLSFDVCENLFYYDEVVIDGTEIYILSEDNINYSDTFIKNLKALIRQGNILIINLLFNKLQHHEENIITGLLWRYIHTFKEIYIITDSEEYTNYGSEVNMTCHWIEQDGTDTIMDSDTFDDKLLDLRMAREQANYVEPTFGLPTVPISKKDRGYKTPGVRAIYSVYTDRIQKVADQYFKDQGNSAKCESIDFDLYTLDLPTKGTLQVIEARPPLDIGKMYFWIKEPDKQYIRSNFKAPLPYWQGRIRVINDGTGTIMHIVEDKMPQEV